MFQVELGQQLERWQQDMQQLVDQRLQERWIFHFTFKYSNILIQIFKYGWPEVAGNVNILTIWIHLIHSNIQLFKHFDIFLDCKKCKCSYNMAFIKGHGEYDILDSKCLFEFLIYIISAWKPLPSERRGNILELWTCSSSSLPLLDVLHWLKKIKFKFY